ncbi:hypothetical protein ACJJTC_002731 [Scirpophaga incertulas]
MRNKIKTDVNNLMDMSTICHTCLSLNRQLYRLSEKQIKMFHKFFSTKQLATKSLLCWECLSILRKIFKFQSQIKQSQNILNSSYKKIHKPISSLGIVNTTSLNLIDSQYKDCKDIPADLNPEPDINPDPKIEPNEDNWSMKLDNEYAEIRTDDVNIVISEEPKIKKEYNLTPYKAQRKQYKWLFNNLQNLKVEEMTKKVSIDLSEIRQLLDVARRDEEFNSFKYKCEHCVRGWNNEQMYLQHKQKHDVFAGDFVCDLCKKRFLSKNHLSVHMSHHLFVRECLVCCYRARAINMRKHLATHLRMVQCLECRKKFPSTRVFFKHYSSVHVSSVFICDYCQKKCKSKRMIEKHMRHYHVSHDCDVCGHRLKNRTGYVRHYNLYHGTAPEEAYCVKCDRKFINNGLYRRHLTSSVAHAEERKNKVKKMVQCPDCGKEYTRTTYMMNHYRHVHTKQSRFFCQLCDKQFLNSTKYVEHQRYTHNGEKKEKNKLCYICGRGFAEKRTLVNHMRTHSGERPFKCEHCNAAFTQKIAMLSHVKYIHMKHKRKESKPKKEINEQEKLEEEMQTAILLEIGKDMLNSFGGLQLVGIDVLNKLIRSNCGNSVQLDTLAMLVTWLVKDLATP